MDPLKRKYDSSSEESDDFIPATPAAKSTPMIPAGGSRKASSSSESSDDGEAFQTPRLHVPVHRPAPGDSSSSEDENRTGNTQLNPRQVFLKREQSDSSSDEDEVEQKNHQGNQFSLNSVERLTHAMSSSDTDDSDAERTVVQNQREVGSESSDESDNENPSLPVSHHLPQNVAKTEKPSSADSSDEESDENPAARIPIKLPVAGQPSSVRNESAQRQSESSSNESDREVATQKYSTRRTSDSDESDCNQHQKIPTSLNNRPHETSSSEDEEEQRFSKPLSNHVPVSHLQKHSPGDKNSDTESSDDDDINESSFKQTSKPTQPTSQADMSSDEELSDTDASMNGDNTILNRSKNGLSDEEAFEQKFNPVSKSIPIPVQLREPLSSNQHTRKVPCSGKRGPSLLKETFKGSNPLQIESALLAADDIGSDDEIWLLQCPKSMDITTLKKQTIDLGKDCDIQLEDGPTFKRFSVAPEQSANYSVNCLLPHGNGNTFQIFSLPIKGKVVIHEHVHVPKLRMPEKSAKIPVPFPGGLKVRHPLLGVDFKEHIAAAKKALEESSKHKLLKKKRKNLSSGSPHLGENGEGIHQNHSFSQTATLPSLNLSDKKKKRNSKSFLETETNGSKTESIKKDKKRQSSNFSDSINCTVGNELIHGNDSYKKKHKKSKREVQSADNSFTVTDGEVQRRKLSLLPPEPTETPAHSSGNITSSKKDKKSKKGDKSTEDYQQHYPSWHIPQQDQNALSSEGTDNSLLRKKSKKSKRDERLLDPSEIKQEMDVSYFNSFPESSYESTSKKRKRKSTEEDILDLKETPSKKKKKHSI